MQVIRLFLILSIFIFWSPQILAELISFNESILPILADNCFHCHGPDSKTRQANLRLDRKETIFRKENPIIVPGNSGSSQLISRITTQNPRFRMPPPDSHRKLTTAEIKILHQWVDQGAGWNKHWAFTPPVIADPPLSVFDARNEIDNFIHSVLVQKKLQPSPKANKVTLLRRVTIDLTGLPPTIEEIDDFLADTSDNAYEKVVDRLLSTTAHAERLALDWMDLSRYADSHGMHADGWRQMWPWRDWVIGAFQRNIPYDQFVTWQLAGDLLELPTHEQRLATAFQRNHPMMSEAGSIEEEFRIQNVFDRVETTATAFLGLTMNCARCHDHKYDPISQMDYYRFSAFFNNVPELGMIGNDGNFGPSLPYPSKETSHELGMLDTQLDTIATKMKRRRRIAHNQFSSIANQYIKQQELVSLPPYSRSFPFDNLETVYNESGKSQLTIDRITEIIFKNTPIFISGVNKKAVEINGEHGFLTLKKIDIYDVGDAFSVSVWIRPKSRKDKKNTRTLLGNTGNKNQYWRGWDLFLDGQNRLSSRLVHNLPDNLLHVRSKHRVKDQEWTHIVASYDGTDFENNGNSLRLFINGRACSIDTLHSSLTRTIVADESRDIRMGRSYRSATGEFGIYNGGFDDLNFYSRALTSVEVARLYQSYPANTSSNSTLHPIKIKLTNIDWFEHWIKRESSDWSTDLLEYRKLYKNRIKYFSQVPLVMVMKEAYPPRDTYLLERGIYNRRRQKVSPNPPSIVMPFSANLPTNRLGFSKWLFAPANPLTARVAVNRYWQMIFGQGLVRTPHDFGVQGQRPTHPRLLDWLAIKFRDSGWNVRELLKLMVTSATYQQSSRVNPDSIRLDPDNKFLWRSTTYRWPAEFLRDSALAASGLLDGKVGGPSVKPYQPVGLWIEKNNFSKKLKTYQMDKGNSLYRRSLYTFIRRTSPPPAMQILDAPDRSVCTIQREVTNTPLQALVLMNDPQFVEAARVLSETVQHQVDNGLEELLERIFCLITSHQSTKEEMNVLKQYYSQSYKRFQQNENAANELLRVGESSFDMALSPTKTAALTLVANLVMNSADFYMKR